MDKISDVVINKNSYINQLIRSIDINIENLNIDVRDLNLACYYKEFRKIQIDFG